MKKFNPLMSALKMHENSSEKGNVTKISTDDLEPQFLDGLKRRKFLGMGLLGFAGLTIPLISKSETQNTIENFVSDSIASFTDKTTSQTDSIQEKIQLLQDALLKKDYRTARALTNSIRISEIQLQAEEENLGTPHVAASQFGTVDSLPKSGKPGQKAGNIIRLSV